MFILVTSRERPPAGHRTRRDVVDGAAGTPAASNTASHARVVRSRSCWQIARCTLAMLAASFEGREARVVGHVREDRSPPPTGETATLGAAHHDPAVAGCESLKRHDRRVRRIRQAGRFIPAGEHPGPTYMSIAIAVSNSEMSRRRRRRSTARRTSAARSRGAATYPAETSTSEGPDRAEAIRGRR